MLRLINKEIDPTKCRILFNEKITVKNFRDHFTSYNSQWYVEEGWITGKNPDESAGMAILKHNFPGNILLEFEACTLLPSTHDINFMWNGEWDDKLNSCGNAYVGSICGWYSQRVGIEKSPQYKLIATRPNTGFQPGKTCTVQVGNIDGNCFIFIDGKLGIEITDPDPIDNKMYTKIAFTAWSSCIRIRSIVIRQIVWKPLIRK